MSEDIRKMDEQNVEEVSGGAGYYSDGWRIVTGLQTGYLALRTKPGYDYGNEIRGCELYNGDRVKIDGATVTGPDGKPYTYVYSPKSDRWGYVNANFLGWV